MAIVFLSKSSTVIFPSVLKLVTISLVVTQVE